MRNTEPAPPVRARPQVITPAERRERRANEITDEIKDEIDRLHEIKSERLRGEAARDLISYIELHHEAVLARWGRGLG